MRVYDVEDRGRSEPWNVLLGPPGAAGARPRAEITIDLAKSVPVDMGRQANFTLSAQITGLHTYRLTNCSAFAILYRPPTQAHCSQGSLIHMDGGPDPGAVDWPDMIDGMPPEPGAAIFGILANSMPTILTRGFVDVALSKTPIAPQNMWVYNANIPAFNFAVNWEFFAGEIPSDMP